MSSNFLFLFLRLPWWREKKEDFSFLYENTNSSDCSESRIKIFVPASFPSIGRFSPVFTTPYWMQENWKIRENVPVHLHGTVSTRRYPSCTMYPGTVHIPVGLQYRTYYCTVNTFALCECLNGAIWGLLGNQPALGRLSHWPCNEWACAPVQ